MKKRFAILMCAAAAVASGCTKKEDTAKITEVKDAKVVISASILDTKAEYDNGMKSGYWNSTDRIGAYLYRNSGNGYAAQATNVTYTNSGEDRSPVAEFTTDSQFGVAEGDVMVGYYPFDEAQASTDASGSAGFSVWREFELPSQTQTGNGSSDHIGAYDFLVATPVRIEKSMISGSDVNVPFTFTHAFSAIKFVVKNDFTQSFSVRNIELTSSDTGRALSGKFSIDIANSTVRGVQTSNSVRLDVSQAGTIAPGSEFVGFMLINDSTLPVASTISITTNIGIFKIEIGDEMEFNRGFVHTVTFSASDETLDDIFDTSILEKCIGNWKLDSFCGSTAELDIYMSLNDDDSFVLYQRSPEYEPTVFRGTYTFDTVDNVFSGTYSDGVHWATSYRVESVSDETMTWVNTANADEVSVYVRSEIPSTMLQKLGMSSICVKRFL